MKLVTIIMVGTAALTFLTIAAGSLQAQVTNVITVTMTTWALGNSSNNGIITTTASPSKHTVATKDILGWLAQAENAEKNYLAGTTFPTGAKLVLISNNNSNAQDFQVLDANNDLLVDVSDIISCSNGDLGINIFSGKQNNTSGLASTSEADRHVLTIKYDDTRIGGSLEVKFYMTGLMTSTTTDTAPKLGIYTERQSDKLTSGVGEGRIAGTAFNAGTAFVLTGTLSAGGKATLTVVP